MVKAFFYFQFFHLGLKSSAVEMADTFARLFVAAFVLFCSKTQLFSVVGLIFLAKMVALLLILATCEAIL